MKENNNANQYKIALYQEKEEGGKVRCRLCPHNCLISEGKAGVCHARKNIGGTLYTLAYNNPCSVSIDPVEKKPLFHFYPGENILSLATAGCNFHCLNCQNWQISQASPEDFEQYRFTPEEIVQAAMSYHTKMIAFTYTEPTIFYEYMYDIAVLAHQKGIKTVIVSNGFINPEPLHDLCPFLDAANIDLKCFNDDVYRKLTTGSLHPILSTLKTLKDNDIWLEITNLIIPTYNDDRQMIRNMCEWLAENGFAETPLHFSRFFPAYKLQHLPPTPESALIEAKEIAEKAGIKYVYIGNMPHLNGENTYCPACNELLIARRGFSVTENNIVDGKCAFCGESIPGRWG